MNMQAPTSAPKGASPDSGPQPAAGGDQMNPIIDALKTIQTWIASVGEKDPTKAEELGSAFTSFIGSLQGGGGAPKEKEQSPEDETEDTQEAPSKGKPMETKGGPRQMASRAMPMNARPGSVPLM
jgi:hypothetical protein